ncbi:DedA family protein [Aquiluna sp. KACHI24]|uniref:DedA family protein n=1 Tax=Aquiluna sp. KACHI24 TaxID=2968831 RepID=UPI00220FE6B2|nr:DedA family protein [Aquiluna sp. KACHI24]BDQ00702.1 alkaline phosphatase [Aquiluna sp. KACHI24]
MIELAISVINQIGLIGAALLIAIEVVVPPIPSEAILLLTGFNVGLGSFGFVEAVIATSVGSLIGATLLYLVGYFFTQERLEGIIAKFGKYVGLPTKDFQKTMKWFERFGGPLVLFGRMFPIIRSLVSIPAGLVKMGVAKFYLFSGIGIVIWNTLWITIGYNLGENWAQGEEFAQILDYIIYGLVALVGIYVAFNFVKAVFFKR